MSFLLLASMLGAIPSEPVQPVPFQQFQLERASWQFSEDLSTSAPDTTPPRRAQNRNPFSPWYRADDTDEWYFDFALGLESEPDYAGSDDNEVEPDLFARVIYKDRWNHRYFLSLGEAGAVFDLGDDWALSAVLEYEEAREDENSALRGLDEGEDTIEGQFTLARRFGDFTIAAVAQPDILGRGKGFVTFVGVGWDRFLVQDRLRVAAGIDVSFGDAEHMATEFAVSRNEAMRTSFSRYAPGAGLKSSTVDLGLEYFLSDRWSVLAGGEFEYYFSRAARSPLVDDEGSRFTYALSLALSYRF